MDIVKILWVVNFFFFAFILLFVWSKVYLVAKRIRSSLAMFGKIENLTEETMRGNGAAGGEDAGTP